jgi:transposase
VKSFPWRAKPCESHVRQSNTAGTCVQRMQKALVQMNLQLHLVISDTSGVTGLRILRDIVAGVTDPILLARRRDFRCRSSEEEIRAALTGHYRPEHLFGLKQNLEMHDAYQAQLATCDRAIEAQLTTRAPQRTTNSGATPPPTTSPTCPHDWL